MKLLLTVGKIANEINLMEQNMMTMGDGKDNINDQWQDHRWWWRRQEWWQVAVWHVGRMFAGVVHWAEDAHDFRNMLRHDDQNEKELSTMGALQHDQLFTIHYHKWGPVVWQTYIKCERGGGNPEDLESAAFEKRRIDPAVTKMHKQMETTKNTTGFNLHEKSITKSNECMIFD